MKKLFSLIALAGVIAACTPEQVDTAFKLAGGKVTVNVEVVDIINGGTYTGAYTVSSTFGTVSGNQIVYQAAESSPVAAGDYTVSVSGPQLAKTYSSNFTVPAVLAGGEAEINVVVPVGEPLNGWTVEAQMDRENAEVWYEYGYLVNTHYPTHAYSHEGIETWYYNNTEYILEGSVEYTWERYGATSNKVDNKIVGFEGIVDKVENSLLGRFMWDGGERTYNFTVSAWAMWNVVQTVGHAAIPVLVWAYKDANENGEEDAGEEHLDLGSMDFEYVSFLNIQAVELPYPGAPGHAHYHAGHGHDAHGSAANAGGGISFNE